MGPEPGGTDSARGRRGLLLAGPVHHWVSCHQDEPSSGMDPCSKRFLWRAVTDEVLEGSAVVLTSHR